ncbi:hypothetical protein Dimus_013442 [Dionaea muscipula]
MRSRKECLSMLIFVKEFYAKMTVIHLKKKDVVKSSVKGIGIEFDHEQCVCYTWCARKKLESVNTSRRCGKSQGTQNHLILQEGLQMMKQSQLPEELNLVTRENGIWWIGSGENRRRDDDVNAPGGRSEKRKKKGIRMTLIGKAVINEATVEGESGSDDQFYDAQVEVEEPVTKLSGSGDPSFISGSAKEQGICGVDPSCPTGRLPEAEFLKFQAEFERKRANIFHDDLEKAKARMLDFSLTPPSPNQTPSLDFLT